MPAQLGVNGTRDDGYQKCLKLNVTLSRDLKLNVTLRLSQDLKDVRAAWACSRQLEQ